MKREPFGNRVAICGRLRTNLLDFPDVLRHFRRRGHQRPQACDLRPANVEEASSMGRQEPLVQARSVVVAIEIVVAEGKLRESVRAVNYGLDPACTGKLAQPLDG